MTNNIVFCGVANANGLVVYYTTDPKTVSMVTALIMNTIDFTTDVKKSYANHERIGNYTIQYMTKNNLAFITMADRDFDHRNCFLLINSIEKDYRERIDINSIATHEELKCFFRSEINKFSDMSNTNRNSPQNVQHHRDKINDIKQTLHDNIELIITRGSKIDDILDSSQILQNTSTSFNKQSNKFRCSRICRNTICALIILAIICVIIVGIILAFYFALKL